MEGKQILKKCYNRLALEGVLKAILSSLIIGFSAWFAITFITWFTPFKGGWWVGITVGLVIVAACMPLFYFFQFRPTTKQVAKRLDRMGLEERVLTMMELENDESYLAMRQREDAVEQLRQIRVRDIKFHISKAVMIAASIIGAFAIAMTIVNAVISDYKEVIPAAPASFRMTFVIDANSAEHGYIEFSDGDYIGRKIIVVEGEDGEEVPKEEVKYEKTISITQGKKEITATAVANDGYYFAGWTTGYKNSTEQPSYFGSDGSEGIKVSAVFMEHEIPEESDSDGDQPDDVPSEEGGRGPSDGSDSNGAGGGFNNNGNVIDGKTDYGDVFDDYFQAAMDALSQMTDLSPELRAIIEGYFNSLLP